MANSHPAVTDNEIKIAALKLLAYCRANDWAGYDPYDALNSGIFKALRTGLVDAVQVIYNIFDQSPEDELFPVCRELNIGVIARVPFDEGSLGGKMTLETRFPKDDWRSGYFGPENLGNTIKRVDKLKQILPAGMTLPEMALRFILGLSSPHCEVSSISESTVVQGSTAEMTIGA